MQKTMQVTKPYLKNEQIVNTYGVFLQKWTGKNCKKLRNTKNAVKPYSLRHMHSVIYEMDKFHFLVNFPSFSLAARIDVVLWRCLAKNCIARVKWFHVYFHMPVPHCCREQFFPSLYPFLLLESRPTSKAARMKSAEMRKIAYIPPSTAAFCPYNIIPIM